MFTFVSILFKNGAIDHHPFGTYSEAREFFRSHISYSPNTSVKRVWVTEHEPNFDPMSGRAIWDESWDEVSKAAGLKG
jgi:hypothetical protein